MVLYQVIVQQIKEILTTWYEFYSIEIQISFELPVYKVTILSMLGMESLNVLLTFYRKNFFVDHFSVKYM